MTIQQAIEKAIEGGWLKGSKLKCISEYDGSYIPKVAFFTLKSDETSTGNWHRDVLALISDHLFWQSLGKAMGWREAGDFCLSGDGCEGGIGVTHEGECKWQFYQAEWKDQWYRFIDHLAEGKDAESFFANL